jgi:hypothetical protein
MKITSDMNGQSNVYKPPNIDWLAPSVHRTRNGMHCWDTTWYRLVVKAPAEFARENWAPVLDDRSRQPVQFVDFATSARYTLVTISDVKG